MCFWRKKKKKVEEVATLVEDNSIKVFFDVDMVPVQPKNADDFKPKVAPEEFVVYKKDGDKGN